LVLRVAGWYDSGMGAPLITQVRDATALSRWQLVTSAAQDADFVGLPADPIEEIRSALSGRQGDEGVELLEGVVDGDPVVATLTRLPLHDNLDVAKVAIRVHPAHRRRGHGRVALDHVVDRVRQLGRSKILGEAPTATLTAEPSEGELFAMAAGGRPVLSEMRRMLDVHARSRQDIQRLREEALAASVGYETVAWCDHTPPELVEAMAQLRALMSTDPPQGELGLEPEVWDSERYLAQERSHLERKRRRLVVAARETRTGRLVGYTDIGVPGGGGSVGYQWDTIVRGEHRGHRLGMLIKLANLDELGRRLPEVRMLNTWNADDNTYMVAVNEQLGFRVMEGWSEWELTL
jgi:GNAT superfamily N-acetyltransferase